MDNEYKKFKNQSSSDSQSSPGDSEIFGDDTTKIIKIYQSQTVTNVSTYQPQTSVVMVFASGQTADTFVDNQKHSQQQKNSSMSSKTRPIIYDEAQRNQDNEEYGMNRNRRQNGHQKPYQQQNQNHHQNYQNNYHHNQQRREEDEGRNYGNNRRYEHDRKDRDFGDNDKNVKQDWNYHHQSNHNEKEKKEQFKFEHQRRNFNQNPQYEQFQTQKYANNDRHNQDWDKRSNRYQPQRQHEKNYNQVKDKFTQRNQQRIQHNTHQNYHDQKNYGQNRGQQQNNLNRNQRENSRNQNYPKRDERRQSNSRSKYDIKPLRNTHQHREHSRSGAKYQPSMKDQSIPQQHARKPQRQYHQESQVQNSPSINTNKSAQNKHIQHQKQLQKTSTKEEQPPNQIQHKKSSKSSQSQQYNETSHNHAHSHITVENSISPPVKGNNKLQESSVWQPSDEQDQEEEQPKSLEKSSFECQQLSIEYPMPPLVVDSNYHNISSLSEDLSLLAALNSSSLDNPQNVSRYTELNLLSIKPIPHKQESHSIQKPQKQKEEESMFTKNDLLILEKMFDSIPLQNQTVFVEIRVKTENVSLFKIKDMSSQLYLLQSTTPQDLKGHKFITIKEFQKSVPRDPQPNSRYQQVNQKIQLKTSKLILAQIKNPLQLLNHKEELLKKFDTFEEREVIKKIETNQKIITKVPFMINVEVVTLKCSSCNGKKSFLWKDQIISHQCKAQCANFLRFNIDSINIS